MNLLSALPELKKQQLEGIGEYITGKEVGRNEVIDDLSKYSFSEEELAKLISKFADKVWAEEHRNIHEIHHEDLAKELLSSLPLWLRKESK